MVSIRPKSLLANSLSSVIASGGLIFSTVLIPAVLSRAIDRHDYAIFATVLSALPFLGIIPQSLRFGAASQLALAFSRADESTVKANYFGFVVALVLALILACGIILEIYLMFSDTYRADCDILRFGSYCLIAYVTGMMAAILVTGPASAYHDFLPDNLAKLWPGLFNLGGVTAVYLARPDHALTWIFLVHLASTWSIAVWLGLRIGVPLFRMPRAAIKSDWNIVGRLWTGFRGLAWWNLTAYFATAAAVTIVAVRHPAHIVPFSIAISLTGITAAGLIAISGPISVRVAATAGKAAGSHRDFFLKINSFFQAYIALTAIVIFAMPQALFTLWVGNELAGEVRIFCLLLLPSYVIRLLTMAFTLFVMGLGRQETLWFSPMVEAAVAVGGCLVLGTAMGINGILLALTISATVRLLLTIGHDARLNSSALGLRSGDILLSAFRVRRG